VVTRIRAQLLLPTLTQLLLATLLILLPLTLLLLTLLLCNSTHQLELKKERPAQDNVLGGCFYGMDAYAFSIDR